MWLFSMMGTGILYSSRLWLVKYKRSIGLWRVKFTQFNMHIHMYVLWLLGNWFGTANIMVYIVQSFSKHGSLEENPESAGLSRYFT